MSETIPIVDGVTFKPVPGYPGYAVGDDGSIWSAHNNAHGLCSAWRRLRPYRIAYRSASYWAVELRCNGQRFHRKVHRLVLAAFVGVDQSRADARHLNGDGLDNRLCNLAYGSRAQNEADKVRHNRTNRGERNGQAVLSACDVREIRDLIGSGLSNPAIAKRYGVARATINSIRAKKNWRHLV